MYKLILTPEERKAIDWIGGRYAHGYDLYHELVQNCDQDGDWESDDLVSFRIPEHIAWSISELIDQDNLACFAESLKIKLFTFQAGIV